MNRRIASIRKISNLTQDDFGTRIGLSRNYVWMIEKGERIPSDRTIADICREFNVNEHWLRTGEGEIFKEETEFSLDQYMKDHGRTELELEILKAYFALPQDIRKIVLDRFVSVVLKAKSDEENEKSERDQLHAELDRQIDMEKEATEKSKVYFSTG